MSFVNLNVEYEGALENLGAKRDLLNDALLVAVDDLTAQLYARVQENLSGVVLERRTGELANAVEIEAAAFVGAVCQSQVFIDEESPEWVIGMTHEYGGTGYYLIEPVNASVLAWQGPAGTVFARRVNHPPAQERSFMNSALEWIEPLAVDEIKNVIAEVIAL